MPTIWDVPELFQLILDAIEADEDLFRLCLVCRSFWDAVTPIVWPKIPKQHGIQEVLDAFPLHEEFESLKPRDKHWVEASSQARFALYATYVKALVLKTPKDAPANFESLIHSKPLSKIFPNLRDLTIEMWLLPQNPDNFFQDAISGLALRTFKMEFMQPKGFIHAATSSLLPQLLRSRDLESFTLTAPGLVLFLPSHVTSLVSLIQNLPHLTSIEVSGLGRGFVPLWTAAGQRPKLQSVVIGGEIPLEVDTTLPADGFKSARNVAVSWIPVHSVPKVIHSIHSPALEHLCLYAREDEVDQDEDEEEVLLETVVDGGLEDVKRFASLITLALDLGTAVAAWSDLRPTLDCHKLEEVYLVLFKSSTMLRDEHIKLMAQAWPALTSLEIEDPMLENIQHSATTWSWPVATLRGLNPLAEFCPSLDRLSISVSAKAVGEDAPQHIGTNLSRLNLGWSIAGSSWIPTALFIAKMWPNVEQNERVKWTDEHMIQHLWWSRIWDQVGEPSLSNQTARAVEPSQ